MNTETIIIDKKDACGPWEGCINSVNYRIERGVPVAVPREVAAVIRESEKQRRLSSLAMDRFTVRDGAKLF